MFWLAYLALLTFNTAIPPDRASSPYNQRTRSLIDIPSHLLLPFLDSRSVMRLGLTSRANLNLYASLFRPPTANFADVRDICGHAFAKYLLELHSNQNRINVDEFLMLLDPSCLLSIARFYSRDQDGLLIRDIQFESKHYLGTSIMKHITKFWTRFVDIRFSFTLKSCVYSDTDWKTLSGIFKYAKGLESLRLIKNNINQRQLVYFSRRISKCTSLKEFEMFENEWQNLDLSPLPEALSKIPSIRRLSLSKNNLNDDDVLSFSTFLSQNRQLKVLDLSFNNISSIGASTVFQLLKSATSLETLDVSRNTITDEALPSLLKLLAHSKSIQSLYLSNLAISPSGMLSFCEWLSKNSNSLLHLDLGFGLVPSKCVSLLSHTRLQSLSLHSVLLKDEAANALYDLVNRNRHLRFLNVSENLLAGPGVERLAAGLMNNSKLEVLDLSWNFFDLTALIELAHSLYNHPSLRVLKLNSIGTFISGDTILTFVSEILKRNRAIRVLSLSENGITSQFMSDFIFALRQNNGLRELDLSSNNIDDRGALMLADYFRGNSQHSIVANIRRILGHPQELPQVGNSSLPSSLRRLNLAQNMIGLRAAVSLVTSLKHAPDFEELDISENNFSTEQCAILRDVDVRITC